jgi:hypothetical protein
LNVASRVSVGNAIARAWLDSAIDAVSERFSD